MAVKKTMEDYIHDIKEKFGDTIDIIDTSGFKNNRSEWTFRCNECGHVFRYMICRILGKKGESPCPECAKVDRYKFIWKSIQARGYRYDYRGTDYHGNTTKLKVRCKDHGEFDVYPFLHYNKTKENGDCPYCRGVKVRVVTKKKEPKWTYDNLSVEMRKFFGDDLILAEDNDYSEGVWSKVRVYCTIHDKWKEIRVHDLLRGHGCDECGQEKSRTARMLTDEEYITKANEVHGNKYDYSEMNYQGVNSYITPICPVHGKFSVHAGNHIYYKCGCPECAPWRHYAESLFYEFVKLRYPDAVSNYRETERLGKLVLDVYIPSLNVAIEFQGEQHFKPVDWFGGQEAFEKGVERDLRKIELCKENGIQLLHFAECRIPDDFDKYNVFTDKSVLMDYIRENFADPNQNPVPEQQPEQ